MNMKTSTVLLLLGAVGIGVWAFKKYQSLVNLQFLPRGVNLDAAGFQVVLGVQNTSNEALQYNSFAGTLSVNGQAVANVSDFTPEIIQANAETPLKFSISANILGVASEALSQMQSGGPSIQSSQLVGIANIGGNQYNVNVQLA